MFSSIQYLLTLQVPGANQQVNITKSTGVVALTKSVTVSQLVMSGGTLKLGQTECLDGWTPSPDQCKYMPSGPHQSPPSCKGERFTTHDAILVMMYNGLSQQGSSASKRSAHH